MDYLKKGDGGLVGVSRKPSGQEFNLETRLKAFTNEIAVHTRKLTQTVPNMAVVMPFNLNSVPILEGKNSPSNDTGFKDQKTADEKSFFK